MAYFVHGCSSHSSRCPKESNEGQHIGVYNKLTTYMGHIRIKNVSDFLCELCGYTFVSKKGIDVHKKKKHRLADKTVTLEGPYCETCEVRFVSDEAHARHSKKEEMKEKWIKILGRPQELVDLFKKYHLVEFLTGIFSSEDFFSEMIINFLTFISGFCMPNVNKNILTFGF